jgi:hypothetical protein
VVPSPRDAPDRSLPLLSRTTVPRAAVVAKLQAAVAAVVDDVEAQLRGAPGVVRGAAFLVDMSPADVTLIAAVTVEPPEAA